MKAPKRFMNVLISAGLLCAGYVLTRYVLFDLHGMKQWPLILLVLGAIIAGISIVLNAKFVPIATGAAYSVSFLISALLQTDSVDPGGMHTNNLWIIWTGAFLVLTVAGIVVELSAGASNKT